MANIKLLFLFFFFYVFVSCSNSKQGDEITKANDSIRFYKNKVAFYERELSEKRQLIDSGYTCSEIKERMDSAENKTLKYYLPISLK